jgi:histidinol-phosphate aminotransferase
MPLTRRGLFQRLATPVESTADSWISARGREAGLFASGDQGAAAGVGKLIRLSSNENPVGPGQHVLDAMVGKFPEGHRYPPNAHQNEGTLVQALAAKFSAKPENITLGAGSSEILVSAVRAFTSPTRALVTAAPSFEATRDTAQKLGSAVKDIPVDDKLRLDVHKIIDAAKGAGLVFFCNPNNPTSTVHGKSTVADMVKQIHAVSPDTAILIDEAYHDYVTDPSYQSSVDLALATPNVFVTRTFSKAYGMAGLRAGYAIGHPAAIKKLELFRMPNGVGSLVIGAAIVALGNAAHVDAERKRNTEVRAFTLKAFADMGITGAEAQANFIFMNIKRPAAPFRDACRAAGVMVGRDFPPFEKTHCRISLGTMDEMQRAVAVFKRVLANPSSTAAGKNGGMR